MAIVILSQVFISILFILLGLAILKKKAYWLISGFATRSKEEQQQLISNGSPQNTAKLLIATSVGMLILLPLILTPFKYAIEVQFGFMLVFLLGGFIYLSKYEILKKRKRSYIISISLFVLVIGSISYLSFLGYQDFQLVIKDDSIEITGMYGDEWKLKNIKKVELMEEMPEVTFKQNGFGTASIAKGLFSVNGYGSCLLFIHNGSSPIIYIELGKNKIFINSKDSKQTMEWYNKIIRNSN